MDTVGGIITLASSATDRLQSLEAPSLLRSVGGTLGAQSIPGLTTHAALRQKEVGIAGVITRGGNSVMAQTAPAMSLFRSVAGMSGAQSLPESVIHAV